MSKRSWKSLETRKSLGLDAVVRADLRVCPGRTPLGEGRTRRFAPTTLRLLRAHNSFARNAASLITLCALLLAGSAPAQAQNPPAVLTHHNDNGRTGANLHETLLTAANVSGGRFGKLFTRAVDGQIYAQPLYVPKLTLSDQSVHNVVFVATEHNSVFAFDADDPNASAPLWQTNLGTAVPSPNPNFGNRYAPQVNVLPEYGITGTPVIDLKSQTLYCVAFTQNGANGPYHNRLHALDITTGKDRPGSPVEVAGSAKGSGYGSDVVDGIIDRHNGQIVFNVAYANSMQYMQRPGLLLASGTLYVGFGSHSDTDPYHGWVMAYNPTTLAPEGSFCVTPNGQEGALWQAGNGLVADNAGYLYFMAGNGDYDATLRNYSDSFVKLNHSGSGFAVSDWFTPSDQATLQAYDIDLGSSGPLLIPGTNLLAGIGKEGKCYLIQTSNMGHYNASSDNCLQSFMATSGEMHCGPVYWDGPSGPTMYVWSDYDDLKAFRLVSGLFQTTPAAQSAVGTQLSGGAMSISANGNKKGTGIVWANLNNGGGDSEHAVVGGILRAFDASTLTELWNSLQVPSRDDLGSFAKFCPPTIANGKVYQATFSGVLAVYGVGNWTQAPAIIPNGGTFYPSVRVTLKPRTAGSTLYYTTDGSTPTSGSTVYSAPFTLKQSMTVNAIAIKSGQGTSAVASASFIQVKPGGVVSINFVGGGPPGNPAPMGATETAGVAAKDNWNNAAGQNGTLTGLVNDLGAATSASVTWSCDNLWSTGIADQPGNCRMMKGYLDTGNENPSTVTVSNLPASIAAKGYDVYIYIDGDNGANRTGTYSIGSTSVSVTNPGGVNFAGTFVLGNNSAGNYAIISGVTGSSFTLTATPGAADDGVMRAPVNAIQIVAQP